MREGVIPLMFHMNTGRLEGPGVTRSVRYAKDLVGIFADESARQKMDPQQPVYEVEMHDACGEVEGGLFFGVSRLFPGKVGREYFMTKGHFHEKRDRGEYYWGMSGRGVLVLMNESGRCWTESVGVGSLHYIAGHVAHRLVNTGNEDLVVGACWPSDAGHDYGSIAVSGFGLRVLEEDGRLAVVPSLRG